MTTEAGKAKAGWKIEEGCVHRWNRGFLGMQHAKEDSASLQGQKVDIVDVCYRGDCDILSN